MELKNCTVKDFADLLQGRMMVCFGASQMPREMCMEYPEYHFERNIRFFADNDPGKWGTEYRLCGRGYPVVSMQEMAGLIAPEDILLITSKYYPVIFEQLEKLEGLGTVQCYVWPAIAPQYKTDCRLKQKIKDYSLPIRQIPKKIHYFWFGNHPVPELEQKCMESWGHFCPDYEIIRWDEGNYDISRNKYMEQAYGAGKWGFVPDYARLDILYRYGGIYLDTDVEVLRNFDELLCLEGFAGFESREVIALGLGFGARKGNACIRKLMEDYEGREFRKGDGGFDMTPSPFIQTESFRRMGIKLNNRIQKTGDMVLLPAECFSPDNNMIPHVTENTFSIHHFAGSWTSDTNRELLSRLRGFAAKVIR